MIRTASHSQGTKSPSWRARDALEQDYIYFITLRRFTHQEELRNKNININKKIKYDT